MTTCKFTPTTSPCAASNAVRANRSRHQGEAQVSYALHVEYAYRCYANLLETVLSGFYDSIGLYREPGYAEIRAAKRWLEVVGLESKAAEPFTQLSYGEQRVALILRAVVKQPRLLILDEPCHGLDPRHRSEVLTITDYIGQNTDSTLLYVTHDPEEQLPCTRQVFGIHQQRLDAQLTHHLVAQSENFIDGHAASRRAPNLRRLGRLPREITRSPRGQIGVGIHRL